MKLETYLIEWEKERKNGGTYRTLAKRLGTTRGTIRSKVYQARQKLFSIEYGDHWELSGDWMIVGDAHCPCTDFELAMKVAAVAEKNMKSPRRLLIAGDFGNFDAFSIYPKVIQPYDWVRERLAMNCLMDTWLETFDEIYWMMGNHDRRLQKFCEGAFDDQDLLALVGFSKSEKVHSSNFGWCTINGHWRVTHPKNFSANRLVVAEKLSEKFQQDIISFHEHSAAFGYDRYNHYAIVNGGCLCEQKKLVYAHLDDSTGNNFQKGFVMLKDDYPYLFTTGRLTDWRRWS